MTARRYTVELTAPQIRALDAACALLDAEMDTDAGGHDVRPAVLDRAWTAVTAPLAPAEDDAP